MERCKTCKFWDRTVLIDGINPGGHCTREKLMEGDPWDDSGSADSLIYPYAEGGPLWTGPEFGCVHHQVKED